MAIVLRANATYARTDLGEDLLLYDHTAGCVHILNQTARLVFEACDGATPADQIASRLLAAFPDADVTTVASDVTEVLARFEACRLAAVSDPSGAIPGSGAAKAGI